VRHNLEHGDQLPAVRSDVKKTKALEWLVEHVELVDSEGNVVDRSLLTPEALSQAIESSEESAGGSTESEPGTDTVTGPSESGEA
jgi:hypothetical protein